MSAADRLFPLAFRHETPFGPCVAIDLKRAGMAARDAILACLHPGERAIAEDMRGARLVEFAGGRMAARLAGCRGPVLRAANGMPLAEGACLSISHSRHHAVALVAATPRRAVGVDIELAESDARNLDLLAERILAPDEQNAPDGWPLLEAFSLKEAAWKALSADGTPVSLRRIVVGRSPAGAPSLRIAGDEDRVEAGIYRFGGTIVAAAAVASRTAISQPAASPMGNQKVSHIQSNGVR